MIAVAICAAILGVLHERHIRFLKLAAHYEELNRPWFLYGGFLIPPRTFWSIAMQEKYEHAACYPWLPVAPDLPEPEGGWTRKDMDLPSIPNAESGPFS